MIEVGKKCPAFNLSASHTIGITAKAGSTLSDSDFRGRRLVLYFYPKNDTPGCTRQALAFEEHRAAFAALGTSVVGVSRDSLERHRKFADKYALRFPLLSDTDLNAHRAFGVWGEKMMYGKPVLGVIRTTFVIDPVGRIERIFRNVKVDGHAEAVIAALQAPGGADEARAATARVKPQKTARIAPKNAKKTTAKQPSPRPARTKRNATQPR
jgi:thioredoxin-dependent peroxiredoxin